MCQYVSEALPSAQPSPPFVLSLSSKRTSETLQVTITAPDETTLLNLFADVANDAALKVLAGTPEGKRLRAMAQTTPDYESDSDVEGMKIGDEGDELESLCGSPKTKGQGMK